MTTKNTIKEFKSKWLNPTMLIIYVTIIVVFEFIVERL